MSNPEHKKVYRLNSKDEFEEVPPPICTIMRRNTRGNNQSLDSCDGVISKVKIHKSNNDTPIGGHNPSSVIDSFGVCQKCYLRYDARIFMVMDGDEPVQLYRRITPGREERLRKEIRAAIQTSIDCGSKIEDIESTVDELMIGRMYEEI